MVPPRAVASGLDIRTVIDPVDDDLGLVLRLHVTTHDAEGHPGLVFSGRKSGNDGLEGPFSWLEDVRVTIHQRKQLAAILKHETQAVGDEA